jgi:hypothetical protein
MTVRCVPIRYGVCHVCDRCEARSPVLGDLATPMDESERLPSLVCRREGNCLAAEAGWFLSEAEDLCPECSEEVEHGDDEACP